MHKSKGIISRTETPLGLGLRPTRSKVMRSERHSDLEEAVHVRLTRKQLPRITNDGYVEYGLRVPQDGGFSQKQQQGNPAAARSRRDPQVRDPHGYHISP